NEGSRNQLGVLFAPPAPDRSRLADGPNYGVFCRQSGQKNGLQDLSGRVVEGATSVETSSLTERQTTGVPSWQRLSAFAQRTARHPGRERCPATCTTARSASWFYRRYSGSLTHCQPRVSRYTARTRKAPAASDSSATTRTSWR